MHNIEKYIHRDNLVGTMRFDFNDGERALANRWNPYLEITREEINQIQPIVNEIMFNTFNSFSSIIKECNGTGYEKTKTIYKDEDNFLFAIKLIPVQGDYNGYIFVYRKGDINE